MYTGGCLCGAIRFEILGPIRNVIHCHCSMCRKAQGGAFATNGIVRATDFRLLSGAENLNGYEATPGEVRHFCRICGSPVMSRSDERPDQIRLRLGSIESDIEERPGAHVFVSSKANWDVICDSLPQYDSYEPDR